uniref:hypothetical protein n=1 Tax=Alistipes sp. An116 TaxID=1965546 RepID=UPI0013A6024A|nr:hypothetical protein [Alistipes sp. An116]
MLLFNIKNNSPTNTYRFPSISIYCKEDNVQAYSIPFQELANKPVWEQKGNNGLGVGMLPASFRVVPESDLYKMTRRNMIDGAIEYIPRKTKGIDPLPFGCP